MLGGEPLINDCLHLNMRHYCTLAYEMLPTALSFALPQGARSSGKWNHPAIKQMTTAMGSAKASLIASSVSMLTAKWLVSRLYMLRFSQEGWLRGV